MPIGSVARNPSNSGGDRILPRKIRLCNFAGMMRTFAAISLLLSALPHMSTAETVKDREGAVREDRAKMENSDRWIYNDVELGFTKAKQTGKPLMVVLRCVPCLSCAGIDTEVLTENKELTPLMDRFVLVRVINANALDLSKFQFDFDLSFTTMFFNADGTTYGRYGSWEHQYDTQNRATETFRQALEGALDLHAGYPANRASLAGKQSPPSAYKTPLDIPALDDKFRSELDWKGNVVKSCVHCHQVGDAMRQTLWDKNETLPLNLIYPHPPIEVLGITPSDTSATIVKSVTPGSPAAKAGLKSGDIISTLAGQPIISTADCSWALHQFPESGVLPIVARRGDKTGNFKLQLEPGWRTVNGMNQRVGNWPMRAMAFGGLRLEAMEEDAKKAKGIPPGKLALLALNVGQYGRHALAKKQGFKKDDIIVEVDGDRSPLSEADLMEDILLHHKPGDRIPVTVLRGGKEIPLKIPVQ